MALTMGKRLFDYVRGDPESALSLTVSYSIDR